MCLQLRWTVKHKLLILDYYRSLGRNSRPKWLGNEFWLQNARDLPVISSTVPEKSSSCCWLNLTPFTPCRVFAGDGTIRLDKLGFLFVQLCNSSIKTPEHKRERHYPTRRTVFSCAFLFSIETAVMNKNMDCIFLLLIPSYMWSDKREDIPATVKS